MLKAQINRLVQKINFIAFYTFCYRHSLRVKKNMTEKDNLQKLNLLAARLESFKVWLHRNSKDKIAPILYENNNAFVNMIKQMLSLNIVHNKEAKAKLLNKMEKIGAIADREWLREKLS